MRKRQGSRPLAELAADVLAPIVEQHGHATAQVILRWADVAGPPLAHVTRPLRVSWPRRLDDGAGETSARPREGATLVVVCESAHALDLQFSAPAILERVNLLYGWRAITRLSIRQAPVEKTAPRPRRNPPPPAPSRLTEPLQGIEDHALRTALERLAATITTKKNQA